MMNDKHRQYSVLSVTLATLIMGLMPTVAWSFDSGSTGEDGDFSPSVDTTLDLPPDGVFNFTTVTIPAGITVTFNNNTVNTPVTLLASGDVTIDGAIDVSGGNSTPVGAAGDGNPGDDGVYGIGGPGGFDGGRGGTPGNMIGATGLGPGAGNPSRGVNTIGDTAGTGCGGGGAGYIATGKASETTTDTNKCDSDNEQASGGKIYGTETLLPLIGGSGGGGGSAGSAFAGSGGGGGGGAILIASSGTVTINGKINANGGNSGDAAGSLTGGTGGGGSGGAIRIIATTLAGNGAITAIGGSAGSYTPNDSNSQGGAGSDGRIRLEAETYQRTASTSPAFTFEKQPQDIFVTDLPSLRISSVAGISAPALPTGNADIILPESTPNPVVIEFATTGVPIGNTIQLTVTPSSGPAVSATSAAITGTKSDGVTSVSVDLPDGPSILLAEVSFAAPVAMDKQSDLSRFTQGEPVKRIRLNTNSSTGPLTTLITASGKEYIWSGSVLMIN